MAWIYRRIEVYNLQGFLVPHGFDMTTSKEIFVLSFFSLF
jgi:hypothetical protein